MTDLQFIPYGNDDADALVDWLCADVWPFHGTSGWTPEKARELVSKGTFSGDDNPTFWIVHPEGGRVGLLAFHEFGDLTPIFDLRIRTAWRGRGIGKQALCWLARYVFVERGKLRVNGNTRADNTAMLALYESCGWSKEAHYRKAWPGENGEYHDCTAWGILKEEFETGRRVPVKW